MEVITHLKAIRNDVRKERRASLLECMKVDCFGL
jgi:hypothetical protein